MSLVKFVSARFGLKVKGNHILQSKEQNPIQSWATTRASLGLEGPEPRQTDLSSDLAPTKGTRDHLPVTHTKMKSVGSKDRSAELLGWSNRPFLPSCPAAKCQLYISSPHRFDVLALDSQPWNWWHPSINMRGGAPKWTHQDVALSSLVKH